MPHLPACGCSFAAIMRFLYKNLVAAAAVFSSLAGSAQTYAPARPDWQGAGCTTARPAIAQTVNILAQGADNTGMVSCNAALAAAISALNGKPGIIYFPAGNYFFNAEVNISRDSIVLRGAGYDSTRLRFDLSGQIANLMNISGSEGTDTAVLVAPALRGAATIAVNSASAFHPGDWLRLSMNDTSYMTSTWAYGSLLQIAQVQSVTGNNITLRSAVRFSYMLANAPVIRRIYPRNNIGFECLAIQRMDATVGQASNIAFEYAANCWVTGVECDSANFAHVEVNHSSNIDITNCYFHDAFAYGSNGQGYGVLLQYDSGECKVEANYFHHLRHGMVLQAGANGNVLAYNYATNPYWTEPGLPDSSAGEIVLHGNFPFMNLAEGNVIGNIVIDDSHGRNGPMNTFFRNRAYSYGLFMNFNPATDSQQFIGNEITNSATGLNFIQGKGHFLWGNNYLGSITSGSSSIPDASLYIPQGSKPPCADGYGIWPAIGRAGSYNAGTIYTVARVAAGMPAACQCVTLAASPTGVAGVAASTTEWTVYPNPATDYFSIGGTGTAVGLEVYNAMGQRVISIARPEQRRAISIAQLSPGVYSVRIITGEKVVSRSLLKMY